MGWVVVFVSKGFNIGVPAVLCVEKAVFSSVEGVALCVCFFKRKVKPRKEYHHKEETITA